MVKKNIVIIFFLGLISMPLLFSVYSIIEQQIIEYVMEEKLEQESLQSVTVDAASVIWLRKNRELLVNGEPFDVKTISVTGNKLILSGLFDTREKELKKQLEKYGQAQEKPASSGKSILLLFFTSYYHTAAAIKLYRPIFTSSKFAWKKYQDKACSLSHDTETPPPRLV